MYIAYNSRSVKVLTAQVPKKFRISIFKVTGFLRNKLSRSYLVTLIQIFAWLICMKSGVPIYAESFFMVFLRSHTVFCCFAGNGRGDLLRELTYFTGA